MSETELTLQERATNFDTMRHIERVRNLLGDCVVELLKRAREHDQSKLEPPEVSLFAEYTPRLAGMTYGSEEYRECLAGLGPALQHHYASNRHHPEHFDCWECPECKRTYTPSDVPDADYADSQYRWCLDCYDGKYPGYFETALSKKVSLDAMNLFDVLEMLVDWKAASERHDDGDIRRSIQINTDRFSISPQLVAILNNTVDAMFPATPSNTQ